MRYGIGLDIGITSIGYAILALDAADNPFRIEKLGSRIFDIAENPKDGSSLALPRREARGARRRTRRHRHRLERIRGLILSSKILTEEELSSLYNTKVSDIYELRTRALDELVTPEEFARILIHLAQRRGFLSNRKSPKSETAENGKLLGAVSLNAQLRIDKGYRTVGEMFYRDEKFSECKRNKQDNYSHTVDRNSVEEEAKMIFASQRAKQAVFASEEIETKYLEILLGQRSYASGPACGPYSGNQVQRMRGTCTFEKGEERAAKASYSFQLFNLFQKINHIRIIHSGETRPLDDDERQIVYDLAHKKAELNYADIRKYLELPDDAVFVGINYKDVERDAIEKKEKIKALEIYHKIKKCVNTVSKDAFSELTHEQLDAIGEALCKNQSDDEITQDLKKAEISEQVIAALLELPNFPKFGHLSVMACKKLIPCLAEGLTYDKACAAAGYTPQASETPLQKFLPPLSADDHTITNPVVRRAISQTVKVVNAIIREMDESPVYINIELARELSQDKTKRNKIESEQKKNADTNERCTEQLKEYGVLNPRGQDIVKFKLWREQDGRCLYSGDEISIERLCEPGYVDVDHIVPYSICFDDRMVNKVLVFASENRQKGNRLPLQYLEGVKRDRFIISVKQSPLSSAKKSRLLKEKITEEDENNWKQRNLQDTQYISAFMSNYIKDNLLFANSAVFKKQHVKTVNGAITSYVRKRWGIKKERENGDLHHAVDAIVIGCITQSMIQRLSRYSYYMETKDSGDYVIDKETGEVTSRFPTPWPNFRDELDIRINDDEAKMHATLNHVNYESYLETDIDAIRSPFVSRVSNHKITGAAHLETIRSRRMEENGMSVSKVALTALKLGKDGEIEGYYNRESDLLLYEALKERLNEFGGNGEKAFANVEFHKPKSDGTPGPVVKKVKICKTASSMVPVLKGNGAADNASMVRCDVFHVDGDGYYFVPVYVSDTVKHALPMYAPTQGKNPKLMQDDDFCFSLYPNDLIRIYSKKEITVNKKNKNSSLPDKKSVNGDKGLFLYYKGLDISNAVISGITHDNTYEHRSIGKTMLKIEKYTVGILGDVYKVDREKRQDFSQRKRPE